VLRAEVSDRFCIANGFSRDICVAADHIVSATMELLDVLKGQHCVAALEDLSDFPCLGLRLPCLTP
jgi:hypothetical protein